MHENVYKLWSGFLLDAELLFRLQVQAGDTAGFLNGQQPLVVDACGQKERDKWHKGFVRWCCKSNRPPSMGENDKDFRVWINEITYNRYTPPAKDTVQTIIVDYSAQTDVDKEAKIKKYIKTGLLPSVAADIWGENGKSLYALLLYYVDRDFNMLEVLLDCLPFSGDAHTSLNIEVACKKALAAVGIGEFKPEADPPVDSVGKACFGSTVDEASSMTKAFEGFEGAPCVCHKINNALKTAAKTEFMTDLDKRLKGIASHFRRSEKVNVSDHIVIANCLVTSCLLIMIVTP